MMNNSILQALASVLHIATTYGQGAYGSALYSADRPGSTVIGPITLPFDLPVTGAQGLSLLGAALISGAVGLFVYSRQRRRKRLADLT